MMIKVIRLRSAKALGTSKQSDTLIYNESDIHNGIIAFSFPLFYFVFTVAFK